MMRERERNQAIEVETLEQAKKTYLKDSLKALAQKQQRSTLAKFNQEQAQTKKTLH